MSVRKYSFLVKGESTSKFFTIIRHKFFFRFDFCLFWCLCQFTLFFYIGCSTIYHEKVPINVFTRECLVIKLRVTSFGPPESVLLKRSYILYRLRTFSSDKRINHTPVEHIITQRRRTGLIRPVWGVVEGRPLSSVVLVPRRFHVRQSWICPLEPFLLRRRSSNCVFTGFLSTGWSFRFVYFRRPPKKERLINVFIRKNTSFHFLLKINRPHPPRYVEGSRIKFFYQLWTENTKP